MPKIHNDKYYTSKELAKDLIKETFKILQNENISEIIEPSAGDGAFSSQLNCIAYDIEPQHPNIIKADFLNLDLTYKKGRLFIGNPPFGARNNLSQKFFKKCVRYGDYIAFIQPISQLGNNFQLYEFDLIYSKDLGVRDYSGVKLHCCFNIYKRPLNGKLNKKPDYRLKDVIIKEYRRNSSYKKPENYDFGICNWGNGTLGKTPKFVGEYAQEVYFYYKPEFLEQVKELMSYENIRAYVNSISMKKISVARLYKYIKENIKGIK